MDEGLSRAVRKIFVSLYKDGLIYIGVSDKFKNEVYAKLKEKWLLNNIFEL